MLENKIIMTLQNMLLNPMTVSKPKKHIFLNPWYSPVSHDCGERIKTRNLKQIRWLWDHHSAGQIHFKWYWKSKRYLMVIRIHVFYEVANSYDLTRMNLCDLSKPQLQHVQWFSTFLQNAGLIHLLFPMVALSAYPDSLSARTINTH